MAKQMLEAELASRASDEYLSPEELLNISVFEGVKAANLQRYPGAVVLRKYRAGEMVCRQGEPGWTAFYLLPSRDLLTIRESQAQDAPSSDLEELRDQVKQISDGEEALGSLAQRDPGLVGLSPDQKLTRAAEVKSTDSELARLLTVAANSESLQACATVSLSVQSSKKQKATGGFVSRMVQGLLGTGSATETTKPKHIPIDGPVDLAYENPVATLHEGELFGEMSCLNRYPRSATVRVTRDCYMIEMLRNILELLQKNKAFKERMDAVYRRRVLESHLRALPIFNDLSDEQLLNLVGRVELVQKEPGEVIFAEGDPGDSIYVIRLGMVKVTQKGPGGDRVLAYRGRGEYVGEIGALHGAPRMATCTALDHPVVEGGKKRRSGRIELIRIKREDIEHLFDQVPKLRQAVELVAQERLKTDTPTEEPTLSLSTEYDHLGLMQGQKLMLIDLDRCTRCDECVRGCASTHADGRTRLLREGPRFGNYLVPSSCRQCLDPVCMIGCPVGSIHKGKTGQIIIEDWCIGCEICAKQCPYDSINMHSLSATGSGEEETVEVTQLAVVCDQCSSLADGTPSCVYACPHDAAIRVDARQFFAGELKPAVSSGNGS